MLFHFVSELSFCHSICRKQRKLAWFLQTSSYIQKPNRLPLSCSFYPQTLLLLFNLRLQYCFISLIKLFYYIILPFYLQETKKVCMACMNF